MKPVSAGSITAKTGVAASTAALVAFGVLGVSRADDTPEPPPPAPLTAQDQQFLDQIRANGIPGEDQTLIAYAHEFCAGPGPTPSGPALLGQGMSILNAPGVFYVIQTIASRAYCSQRVPMPPVARAPGLQTPGPAPGAGLP